MVLRALAGLVALLLGLNCAQARVELLHQERSLYRTIFVTQDGDQRCMTFRYPQEAGRQSCKLLHDPDRLVFAYTRLQLSALFLNPNPRRILIIGEGGGTMPTALQRMFPEARIDVVELDQAVDSVAVADSAGLVASRVYLRSTPMPMPVELDLRMNDGTTQHLSLPVDVWSGGPRYTAIVAGPKTVVGVTVDPKNWYPDVQRQNNRWDAPRTTSGAAPAQGSTRP